MNPRSRDPLTPEERELASRLSRIGPHGEPPATLDARILSAAQAALATAPSRQRRWPAVLGVAATLALAVGISWQMRPRPEAVPALEEGPAAAPQVTAPHADVADAAPAMPPATPSEAEAEAKATLDAPPPQLLDTAPWCYVRLRRSAYSDDELRSWRDRLQKAAPEGGFVFFKHEDSCAGPALARRFLHLP